MTKRRKCTPVQCRVTQGLEAGPRKWLWLLSKGEREFTKGRVPMGTSLGASLNHSLHCKQRDLCSVYLPARADLPPTTRRLGNH